MATFSHTVLKIIAFLRSSHYNSEIFDGLIAQLVEQGTENPCVGGSIPPQATIFFKWLWKNPFLDFFRNRL